MKAVENGGTVVGIRCKDGVVLAVEKIITSKLLKPGANKRIATVDRNFGIVRQAPLGIFGLEMDEVVADSGNGLPAIGFFRPYTRWTTFRVQSQRRSGILAEYLQGTNPHRSAREPAGWLRPSIHALL